MTDPPRKLRETARARVYRLGDEPTQDLSASTTASERIEMVALLTRRAWELSGKPWPTIPRSEWPVTVIRIDILTAISGVPGFAAAWGDRLEQPVRGRTIPFLGRTAFLANKRASGRHKDLGDVESLGEKS